MFAYAHLRSPRRDGALLVGSLVVAAVVATIALAIWHASPYGRYLHHQEAGGPLLIEAALFCAGWAVMIVAMMLPTSIPMVATFGALVRRRENSPALVVLLVVGYLVTWSAFGLVAYLGDRLVHAVVDATPVLSTHPQLIAGLTLAIAGAWQFSPLKYSCLDACRSPFAFLMERWAGRRPEREALSIGVSHGLFCVGCCWSLMLVMFGLGLGSLAWMVGLGAVMAVEKNASWGLRITRPLGAILLLAAVAAVSG